MATVLFALALFDVGEGVCVHCKDTIAGCLGDARCPLVADVANNARIFEEGTLAPS